MNPRGVTLLGAGLEATGFPIEKIPAKLAVGYTLDENSNASRVPPACFEPTLTTSW